MVTVSDAINLDSYYVNIQMDENGTDRSGGGAFGALYFNDTENNNGSLAKGTYNIPYTMVIPRITT